ncbi:MAG: hypothetical protein ACR2L4_06740 [Actinomycetota bacterium]
MSDGRAVGGTARDLGVAAALTLSALIGLVLYLRVPIERELVVPPGVDAPAHLWRAKLVAATDLRSLFDASPRDFQVNPDRVGLPVLASVLSGVGITPWRLMFLIPALAASLLGLAGWAFARAAEEPLWAAPIYAIAVVTSVPFALTTKSYLDNSLADGMIVAGAASLLLVAGGPGAGVLAAILMAGAILMHWAAGGVFWAVALLFGLLLIPRAISDRRRGDPWSSTSAARVLGATGGALAIGAIPLLLTPGGNLPDRGTGQHFYGNVRRFLPRYRVPLALATVGLGASLVRTRQSQGPRPRTILLLGVWMLPAGIAAIGYAAGTQLPLMRFLGVAFPMPLLAAALLTAVVAAASRIARPWLRIPGLVLASAVAVATLGASTLVAEDLIDDSSRSITPEELGPIRAAVAYANQRRAPALVIVVSKDAGRAFRRVRMLAPARLISRTGVFEGKPGDLFARDEAEDGTAIPRGLQGPELKNAQISADGVALMRIDGAVALALSPFLDDPRAFAANPAHTEIADGVFLLGTAAGSEEATDRAIVPPPIEAPHSGRLIRDSVVALLLLLLTGLGWSVVLVPAALDVRIALAPSFGLAAVLLIGTVLGLMGVALGGGKALVVCGLIAVAGGSLAFIRDQQERRLRSDQARRP